MDLFYKFLQTCAVHRYAKGEVILQQDEMPLMVYVVRRGVIKTYNLTVSGDEKPIAFTLKDEIFPIEWIFTAYDHTRYYYEALTDCEVYVVPLDEYRLFLESNSNSLFALLRMFANQHVDYQMRINALEQSKAADKVLYTLAFFAHRFGKGVGHGTVEIQVPFTQQDMANFMGLARETTAIELKKLEREDVISYQHRSYVIYIAKLEEKLGEDTASALDFKLKKPILNTSAAQILS